MKRGILFDLQRIDNVQNANNESIPTVVRVDSVWGTFDNEVTTGSEFEKAGRIVTQEFDTIRIRYRSDINIQSKWQLYNPLTGDTYSVVSVANEKHSNIYLVLSVVLNG